MKNGEGQISTPSPGHHFKMVATGTNEPPSTDQYTPFALPAPSTVTIAPQALDSNQVIPNAINAIGGVGYWTNWASTSAGLLPAINAITTTVLAYKSPYYEGSWLETLGSDTSWTQFIKRSFDEGVSFLPEASASLSLLGKASNALGEVGLALCEAPDLYTTVTNWGNKRGDTALGDAAINTTLFVIGLSATTFGDGPGFFIAAGISLAVAHWVTPANDQAIGYFIRDFNAINLLADLFSNTENDLASLYAPDIYLYPTQQEQVQVSLGDTGDLTSTIPSYPKGGWRVDAMPSGQLSSGSRKYGYLWYEASVNATWQTQTGWIVSGGRDGFIKWAQDNLPPLGLNSKETSDFIDYWQTRLPQEPYYLVAPQTEALIDQTMPLQINPAPQTMLRVWLYVTPLSYPVSIKPFTAQPPVRRGFTAVEWGVAM